MTVEIKNVTKAEVRADGLGWIRITWDTPVTKDHADYALSVALVGHQSEPSGDVAKMREALGKACDLAEGLIGSMDYLGTGSNSKQADDQEVEDLATLAECREVLSTLPQEQWPYLADRFKWAAPGDRQEDAWLLRFCDNDVRDAIWTGPEAEAEAWAAWNRHAPGYNCYLFRLATMQEQRQEAAGEIGGRAFGIANGHMLVVGASLESISERTRYVERLARDIEAYVKQEVFAAVHTPQEAATEGEELDQYSLNRIAQAEVKLSPPSFGIEPLVEPCPVCGCEVRGQGGYLQCECPAAGEEG